MKNKKILKVIWSLILICVVILGAIIIKEKSEYTLEETKELVKKGLDLSDNVYLITTYYDENENERGRIEIQRVGNYEYIKQEEDGRIYCESFIDYNEEKLITVTHTDEKIFIWNNHQKQEITEDSSEFLCSSKRNELYAHLGIYKFLGREKVNDRKCIIVSLTDNNKEGLDVTNYYIDIETGYILKQENIKDGNVNSIMINQYFENVVKEEEIKKYDAEKYADYEMMGNEL